MRSDYAYVGRRTEGTHLDAGVLVVNVADPWRPNVVGQIGPPFEANVGETSRELRIWPDEELLMVLRYRGRCQEELDRTRFLEGNSNLGDALRFERTATARSYAGPCAKQPAGAAAGEDTLHCD